MSKDKFGLIHIYCGDGKGKTTACMGLAARALGKGFNVLIIQFLKNNKSGELTALENFENAKIMYGTAINKFTFQMSEDELCECEKCHEDNLKLAQEYIANNKVDLLIMDEVINAVSTKTLSENVVVEFLKGKPAHLEVAMSGVSPSDKLIELADYVTCVKKVKHPFDKGVNARAGIEF